MKFLKIVFWIIFAVVALYYAVEAGKGIWINSSNKKREKPGNYKNYGTIYKSSKEKISNIQSEYNEKLGKELSQ